MTCCRKHWEEENKKHAYGDCVNGILWNPIGMPFIMCQICGNKRCPKATDCSLECSGSNEPGQLGSVYGPARLPPTADEIAQELASVQPIEPRKGIIESLGYEFKKEKE